jgi:hypothetical protein
MARESFDVGAKFAAVFATPGHGVRYQLRQATNREFVSDTPVATPEQIALRAPVWLRLDREGDQFSAFYSSDGATWTAMVWSPQTIAMPETVHIGLAVTSHDNQKTVEARISHVTIIGEVDDYGPLVESQDIGVQAPPVPVKDQ